MYHFNIFHERNETEFYECAETVERFELIPPGMLSVTINKIINKPDFNEQTDWVNVTAVTVHSEASQTGYDGKQSQAQASEPQPPALPEGVMYHDLSEPAPAWADPPSDPAMYHQWLLTGPHIAPGPIRTLAEAHEDRERMKAFRDSLAAQVREEEGQPE